MGKSLLIRWATALVLVLLTYNPTSFNYVAWAANYQNGSLPVIVLCGLVLAIGYIIFLRATFRSIGTVGIVIVVAFVAALLWVLWSWGWISLDNPGVLTWVGLIALSFVLGVGLSWSIIRRRLSGQLDVDDVEE